MVIFRGAATVGNFTTSHPTDSTDYSITLNSFNLLQPCNQSPTQVNSFADFYSWFRLGLVFGSL